MFRLGRRVGFTIDFDQSISIPDLDATPVCPDKLAAFKYVKNIGNGGAPDAKHNSEILQGFDHEEIFLPGDAKIFFYALILKGPNEQFRASHVQSPKSPSLRRGFKTHNFVEISLEEAFDFLDCDVGAIFVQAAVRRARNAKCADRLIAGFDRNTPGNKVT